MAQEMLLINPRRRRKSTTKRRSKRAGSTRRRRRNPIGPSRSSTMSISGRRRRSRRRNPISVRRLVGRRRRNPIRLAGLSSGSLIAMLKDAAIGGAGAVAMDAIMGQLNGFLPASFQTNKTTIGVGDAVKAAITALLGQVLSKPTKGLSRKMAAGSLTVQAYDILSSLVPTGMTMGYASPARIIQGSARVGPTAGGMLQGFGAYVKPGRTALLNAYQRAGGPTAMLNGRSNVQAREGVSTYR